MLTTLAKLKWWQQIVLVMLATMIYIQIFGVIGTKILAPRIGWDEGGIQPAGTLADSFAGRFARWDSGYYLQIAQHGYQPDGCEFAFFPLYPLLIRSINQTLGLSLLWSGLIISTVCFVGSGLLLYKWVERESSSQQALWSIVWLCIFPTSFFFSSLYTEAPFLLASIASIYFARRGQFVVSGLAIALAGATRPTAFLLAIPYILEFLKQKNFHWLSWLKFILGGLVAPLGTLAYLLFLGNQRDNLNMLSIYTANQSAEWNRVMAWPWITLYDGVRAAIFGININTDWFSRMLVWHDLIYALMALAFAIWALIRFRLSISAYLLTNVLFLFANHGPFGYAFYSLPRYLMVLFPIYPLLAALTLKLPSPYRWLVLMSSALLLGVLSAWFATGRWVA